MGGQDGWVDVTFFSEPPMVKKVVITQDSTTIYDSQTRVSNPAGIGTISIEIIFNETMKTEGLPVSIARFGKTSPYTQHIFGNGSWSKTTY